MLKPILTHLAALLLTPLGLLLAAETSKPSKAETFVTPKRDRAGMASDVPIDKSLPNVLILGDSISIGYTRQVREGLKGKANVIRPNANCGDTRHGLAQIETWLGDGKWQVIHFNWGLHDLCYRIQLLAQRFHVGIGKACVQRAHTVGVRIRAADGVVELSLADVAGWALAAIAAVAAITAAWDAEGEASDPASPTTSGAYTG
jgi:hypothetical protein